MIYSNIQNKIYLTLFLVVTDVPLPQLNHYVAVTRKPMAQFY